MHELKPCPFCGGPAQLIKHWIQDPLGRPRVDCQHCRIGVDQMETEEQCIAMWNRRTPPVGMALVPRAITAESGHKARMIGDFVETIEDCCPECGGSGYEDGDDCEVCEGSGGWLRKVAVEWPTIKAIHRRIIELSEADNE